MREEGEEWEHHLVSTCHACWRDIVSANCEGEVAEWSKRHEMGEGDGEATMT